VSFGERVLVPEYVYLQHDDANCVFVFVFCNFQYMSILCVVFFF